MTDSLDPMNDDQKLAMVRGLAAGTLASSGWGSSSWR
jgi:hypothetical protein